MPVFESDLMGLKVGVASCPACVGYLQKFALKFIIINTISIHLQDYKGLLNDFGYRISKATAEKPLVIMIDSLNQLTGNIKPTTPKH